MSETNNYYILEAGKKNGPFTLEELFEMPVSPSHRVLSPLSNDWTDAQYLPEFKYFFNSLGIFYPTQENAAGFWLRLAAYIIDVVCLAIVTVFVLSIVLSFVPLKINLEDRKQFEPYMFEIRMVAFFVLVLYHSILESSKLKASVGKYILGLSVVDPDGYPLTFMEAIKRNLGKIVSELIFYLGYLMVLWTEKKQALHDQWSGTFVVRKNR